MVDTVDLFEGGGKVQSKSQTSKVNRGQDGPVGTTLKPRVPGSRFSTRVAFKIRQELDNERDVDMNDPMNPNAATSSTQVKRNAPTKAQERAREKARMNEAIESAIKSNLPDRKDPKGAFFRDKKQMHMVRELTLRAMPETTRDPQNVDFNSVTAKKVMDHIWKLEENLMKLNADLQMQADEEDGITDLFGNMGVGKQGGKKSNKKAGKKTDKKADKKSA